MMTIAELVGTPYKTHGRDLSGLDCYGAAILAEKILVGKTLPDAIYSESDRRDMILRDMETSIPNIKLNRPEKGAIVEITVFGQPSHVGVCLGDGSFIHAMKKTGVVIEPLARYSKRIKGYYRAGN
jgi:cell wall-associated NlpC family hydrolase